MNNFKRLYLMLLILVLSLGLMMGCSNEQTAMEDQTNTSESTTQSVDADKESLSTLYGAAAASADQDLTVEEMLTYAIQDEYLAHGEYVFILESFGDQSPFNKIIQAEEQHIASLEMSFEANDFAIPEDLSQNYLVVPEDVETALETGVKAEIENIEMYEKFLEKELPEDVRTLFVSLRDGSEKHLDAFQNKLGR